MTRDTDRIVVEVPASDSRRERIERHVFEQLAALRVADRADAAVADTPGRARWWLALAAATAAAVVILVLAIGRGHDAPTVIARSSSIVVTPVGGGSRFTVGDAVIDAGGDTSVEVKQGDGGVVTLLLARGSVDCDVTPRPGRPPFFVIAGDVTVEVVGTRFTVTRGPAGVRVDVARGKVRVASPDGERFVTPGETWSSAVTATAQAAMPPAVPVAPAPPTVPDVPADSPREPARTSPQPPTPHETFVAAQRLQNRDVDAAARGFRQVANGADHWAALALYTLADLDASRGKTQNALAEIDEYQRRFAKGANLEDTAWLRVEVLRKAARTDDARAAAADYLRRFPSGTYVIDAQRLGSARP